MKSLLILLLLALALPGRADDLRPTLEAMAPLVAVLPVQDDGRVKPIASVARVWLLAVHERGAVRLPEGRMSATAWFMEVLTDQEAAFARPVFTERNPEVIEALGLEPNDRFAYAFADLAPAMSAHREQLGALSQMDREDRDLTENGLVDLMQVVHAYHALAQSMTVFLPLLTVGDELAATLGIEAGLHDHWSLLAFSGRLQILVDDAANKSPDTLTAIDQQVLVLADQMRRLQGHGAEMLAVVPPTSGDTWLHPWQLPMLPGTYERAVASGWAGVLAAWRDGDSTALAAATGNLRTALAGASDAERLDAEVHYLDAGWFTWAKVLQIVTIALLALAMLGGARWPVTTAFVTMTLAVVVAAVGIALRIWILQRPPVATLYESIIFVSTVSALICLIWEGVRRDGLALFIGAAIAIGLLFVADAYADDGDTMGMLQAVLNSRFWLTTHVLTIAIGYSIALVAGLAGHCHLMHAIAWPERRDQRRGIERAMHGINLVALFFVLVGTILGGVWADQSWGRFWGWDPKENGALWIVLWILMLLHLRLAGVLPPLRYAAGLVLLNAVVIMAWFGVNLLGVGLHSYGFADSVVRNLVAFVAIEIILAGLLLVIAQRRLAKA